MAAASVLALQILSTTGAVAKGGAREERLATCSVRDLAGQAFPAVLDDGTTLKYLGRIAGSPYGVFYYSHVNLHMPPGLMSHGVNLVVFVGYGCKYLGLYEVDDVPVAVKGRSIYFDCSGESHVLTIPQSGPPPKAWICETWQDFTK